MAFEKEQPRVADSIGDISMIATDYVDEEVQGSIGYEIQMLQADGSLFRLKSGDLVPHLTSGHIDGLRALMAHVREKSQKLIK